MRPLRFGYQLGPADQDDPVGAARRAEHAGFDTVVVADHVGSRLAPLPALAAMAVATERIRLGTMVLNNEMRHPVQTAWEAVTLDRLSGGRFELGLGAGHTPQEFAAVGVPMAPAAQRKARLAESVEVMRRLLDGETVTWNGDHVRVQDASVERSVQDRLPILVGGNGAALLHHAGAHADIVGLQGLGRTLPDGHRHSVRWDVPWLEEQVGQVLAGAAGRPEAPELSALVQVTDVRDDGDAGYAEVCEHIEGLTPETAAAIPYLLIGTVDEIVEKVVRCRADWRISYFVVRELDAFAPVIAACRGL